MSIQPATDIILDVARAADPARVQIAIRKLETAGGDDKFSTVLAGLDSQGADPAMGQKTATGYPFFERMRPVMDRASASDNGKSKMASANEGLEAFLLQTMIEAMLPQKAAASFGQGNAGNIFKSMLAEHLAKQIARAGGVGIAKNLNEVRKKLDQTEIVLAKDIVLAKQGESGWQT